MKSEEYFSLGRGKHVGLPQLPKVYKTKRRLERPIKHAPLRTKSGFAHPKAHADVADNKHKHR